ncbi:ABC transporter substrate-binding protein [Halomonas campisalis]|uniref:ABC transporter substrate-binding protein n=1 Tax=Billgrantia campisalis TaxID=74661 RepID=A0ABS9P6F0_9GAMM|nr:ABC transporter substrate-binding protein [Halomonas campisalis]MCG6657351.1 ABC transporter substrate-binding protein [Halomonas campisalis]MDR5863304.1 ABC transporter substrate-binding protein [Halomonas campisalis]
MRNRIKRLIVMAALLLACPGALLAQEALRVELQLEPPHLDPTRTASGTTAEATHLNIFQGLTRIDRHGEVQPALAKAWDVAEDGLSYRFVLREGVQFHDGQPFDAEVAAYSLRRLLDERDENPQRHLFQALEEVVVLSPLELSLTLSRPDVLLPFRLGLSAAVMVHPVSVHTNTTQPIGTGPYAFVAWKRSKGVHLRAFDGYWGESPAIEEVLFTFTPNRLELESGLAEGLIDLYPDASSLMAHMLFTQRVDYVIQDGISEGQVIVAINHGREPFGDRRVRRAISHAIDKPALLAIYPTASPPLIGSHFSPRHPAYVDLSDRYPYDQARARALLEAAGHGEGLHVTIAVPPTQYAERSSLYIASDLEAVGIGVELQRITWGEWIERVFTEHDYDLTIVAHVEPFDIDIYARDDYYFNFHSPAFQALWARIEAEQDPARRNRLLEEAQRYLADEAVNVFLFMKPQQAIRKAGLQGVWGDAPIPAVVLEELYWE